MFGKLNAGFQRLLTASARYLAEAKRTGWALFLVGFGLLFLFESGREIFVQQAGVLIWKLLVLGAGIQMAHIARKALFPYLDNSEAVNSKTDAGAITFVGVAIIYAAIIVGLCGSL